MKVLVSTSNQKRSRAHRFNEGGATFFISCGWRNNNRRWCQKVSTNHGSLSCDPHFSVGGILNIDLIERNRWKVMKSPSNTMNSINSVDQNASGGTEQYSTNPGIVTTCLFLD
ncbi:hypothetical protein PROFUN_05725 [Planoprotostelium fungivorum]|uniref:Uncharacterized protein n=1 Tax=Planoprotostelium fungivorum TaxID=1890364 RepID=A0A2P6NQH9_9EUKA|nr:hypothetical protein PROFUN_05725 [Planoprotostelium fungivorum]